MGTWGTGIYEGDIALDLRNDYKTALKYSLDDEHALKIFIEEHKNELEDSDDGPVTWLVLAQSMWKMGRLTDEILEKAKRAAEDDLNNWKSQADEKTCKKRKKNLDMFIEQLCSPQPDVVPVKRVPPFVCDWKRGDAFLWKDKGAILFRWEKNEKLSYLQDYGIVIIFDKIIHRYGRDFLKVYLKFSENCNIGFEDIDKLPYMSVEHWIRDDKGQDGEEEYTSIEHKIGSRKVQRCIVNGKGHFCSDFYSFGLIIRGTDFSDKLKYLGNCSDIVFPKSYNEDSVFMRYDRWRILEEAFNYFIPSHYNVEHVHYNYSKDRGLAEKYNKADSINDPFLNNANTN